MSHCRCTHWVPLGLAFASCSGLSAGAAPPDRDYENIVPAPRPAAPVSAPGPPGLPTSPLAVADRPSGAHPRMRFVMRDGSILVGEVLGFDGQMYALRLPHGTMLARRDFFTAVTPVSPGAVKNASARAAREAAVRVGARY